uniref:Uncharacterized protein n=1 Tax=Aeromonas sobria TaxID=646 RepID=A0A2H4ZHR8_AERSO|nr:hypothetical protein [Aeromonas sobria]
MWGIEGAAPLTSPGLLEAAKRAKSNTGTLANNQYSKKIGGRQLANYRHGDT